MKAVRRRIEYWRRTRKKGSWMPEKLWRAAAALADTHGVPAVARALRLDRASLRKRCAGVERNGEARPCPPAGFVEIPAASIGSDGRAETVVEMSTDDGSKMTIRRSGEFDMDVGNLAETFWKRRR